MLITPRLVAMSPVTRMPARAAAVDHGPQDAVELGPAPKADLPKIQLSAAYCAGCAALSFVTGPVAHGVGKALKSLGLLPGQSKPAPPESPLGPLPASRLDKPLLIVHGWHSSMEFFDGLTDKLLESGQNGAQAGFVRKGELFADAACTMPLERPTPDMKVFLSVFSSNRLGPCDSAPELKSNIDAIRKLTGQPKIDVAGYSMGGLATQAHLDRNEDHGVHRFMMLGTPNQGVGLAGLCAMGLENERKGYDLRWLLDIKDIQPDDRGALEWLRPTSPLREDLHSRWETQKSKVDAVLHLGSRSVLTPGMLLWPGAGDGTVPEESLHLPGLEVRHVASHGPFAQHKNLLSNPDTYLGMREFFGWR